MFVLSPIAPQCLAQRFTVMQSKHSFEFFFENTEINYLQGKSSRLQVANMQKHPTRKTLDFLKGGKINIGTCITALKKQVFPKLLSPFTVIWEVEFMEGFSLATFSFFSLSCSFLLSFSSFLFSSSILPLCFAALKKKKEEEEKTY